MTINPNSEFDWIKSYSSKSIEEQSRCYPQFFCEISFEVFRHLRNLTLEFINPVTVISGTNKSGKTTALMAIACSHYNFQRRRITNGDLDRNTWGDVMRFTDHDVQDVDWTYHVKYRRGTAVTQKQGFRNHTSRKWSGVAKKQGQIGTPTSGNQAGRQVTLIDLERLQPARHLPSSVFLKAKAAPLSDVDDRVSDYLSYILEQNYDLKEICSSADNVIYSFQNDNQYSSYNSASGEDVLTRLIRDIVDTPAKSLILIEEIEVGLHPKIQRRLMDVIRYESHQKQKQFIVTTHSQTILSSVCPESRLFIDSERNKCIKSISSNAALSKMDSIAYPLINLLVEDRVSHWIVVQAIQAVSERIKGFGHLINIVIVGNASKTYDSYVFLRDHYSDLRPKCGYACILDGDQRASYGRRLVPEDHVFFLMGTHCPEYELLSEYLHSNTSPALEYHLNSSNPHCLFQKMSELGICANEESAMRLCWDKFLENEDGQRFFDGLCSFLIGSCRKFSSDL